MLNQSAQKLKTLIENQIGIIFGNFSADGSIFRILAGIFRLISDV
ncbi:hypothetical protein [Nostoc sp.]